MAASGVGERRISRRFYRLENLDANVLDQGGRAESENRYNFEVAWETCNKGKHRRRRERTKFFPAIICFNGPLLTIHFKFLFLPFPSWWHIHGDTF